VVSNGFSFFHYNYYKFVNSPWSKSIPAGYFNFSINLSTDKTTRVVIRGRNYFRPKWDGWRSVYCFQCDLYARFIL